MLEPSINQLLDNLKNDIESYKAGFRIWQQKFVVLQENHAKLQRQAMVVRNHIGHDEWDRICQKTEG